MLRRRFCQRVSVDRSEQFRHPPRNFTKRVVLNYKAVRRWAQVRPKVSPIVVSPRQDFLFLFWTWIAGNSLVGTAGTRSRGPSSALWCETHNSLLKSCMATFNWQLFNPSGLGTLGSCLGFRKFPKLAAPRGAALHVMYCTCVNMCIIGSRRTFPSS